MLPFFKKVLVLGMVATMANCISTNKNFNSKSNDMMSIYRAIDDKDIEQLKKMINSNINLEVKNKNGETPLMYAIYADKNEAAMLLMRAGANVNAQDKILNSPFLYTGAEGNLEMVKAALNHGADFGVFNRYGGTALIPAAEKGHLEVVKILANTPSFPIDHVNNLGWTALMEAVILSDGGEIHVQIIKTLIEADVNVNIPDNGGITPLQHAKKRNFVEIIKLLDKASAL